MENVIIKSKILNVLEKTINYIKFLDITRYMLKKGNKFHIYFGVPGSGKTTFAAYLTRKYLKKHKNVYSNVAIKGAYSIDALDDVGSYYMDKGVLLIDEAGIDYSNRSFKTMPKYVIKFYKYHRKYDLDVAMFSQDLDIDIKFRKLATSYFIMKRSIIPFFVTKREIKKKIGIDEMTKEIIDEHYFVPFSRRWILSAPLWKMFDTKDTNETALPHKDFYRY